MKVACFQMDVVFGDPEANAARVAERIAEAGSRGVGLAVFPEAVLTGYCVEACEAARALALPVREGPKHEVAEAPESVLAIRDACARHGVHAVFGFAGSDEAGLYNGAILAEPSGRMRLFRKVHLPELGLDKFVAPGNDLPVFETELGRIGILVCFDLRVPEAARVLALRGADVIVLPTNWPEGADFAADCIAPVRAAENKVFLVACNRVGEEGGFRFIGKSGVYGVAGQTLAKAGCGEETIEAELDPALARNKRNVAIPGRYESEVFGSRRPDLYGPIVGGDGA
ncbi:MAG: carbon-nitrogen hydrolase family protein [Fimbriimonadales bacterium]|nr:carbon-nitrogen hydrolase family protein [Fimbriimonadales bacterium]